jgi:hypothetical protein
VPNRRSGTQEVVTSNDERLEQAMNLVHTYMGLSLIYAVITIFMLTHLALCERISIKIMSSRVKASAKRHLAALLTRQTCARSADVSDIEFDFCYIFPLIYYMEHITWLGLLLIHFGLLFRCRHRFILFFLNINVLNILE